MADDPTHIYVDLDILNNDQTTNEDPPHLRFEETRNAPFINNTSEYFCTIIRFSLQLGNSLPIFIPRIQIGQPDVNKTVYSVTIVNRSVTPNVESTVFLTFSPWNTTVSPPTPPLVSQDLSTDYYYVNSYQHFVEMINSALAQANTSANTGQYPPYMEFDNQTNRFALYANKAVFDANTLGAATCQIHFNNRLYQLLSTFPAKFKGNLGEKNYEIVIDSRLSGLRRYYNDAAQFLYAAVSVYQDISTVATWNPVSSIVFCTSLIPVQPSHTGVANLYDGVGTNLVSGGNNANVSSILTDFEVSVNESNQYRPTITMIPQAEYRLVEMNAVTNLNKIDLIAYWKTHYGDLIPLKLQPGCAAHVKLLFRHRRFHNE